MKEIQNIYSFFENIKSVKARIDETNNALIINCEILNEKYHSIMILIENLNNKIYLRIEYNSLLLDESPVLLDKIKIENFTDLKSVLKNCTQIKFCPELFQEINK